MEKKIKMESQETVNTPLSAKLPGFVLGWAITDLIFCCLRTFSVLIDALAILGILHSHTINVLFYYLILEMILNLMIVLFGGVTNIMLLCRNAFAVKIAYVSIFFTACSILFSFSQLFIAGSGNETKGSAYFFGKIMGFLAAVCIRCILLSFYWKAISMGKAFFSGLQGSSEAQK